jgi:hypothetical protein
MAKKRPTENVAGLFIRGSMKSTYFNFMATPLLPKENCTLLHPSE